MLIAGVYSPKSNVPVIVDLRLLSRMHAEGIPKHDIATPNTVDNLLDYPLTQERFSLRYRGDLESIEPAKSRGVVFFVQIGSCGTIGSTSIDAGAITDEPRQLRVGLMSQQLCVFVGRAS